MALSRVIGKVNVPFHTTTFSGSEIGTGYNWTKLSHLSTTEYLNYVNNKFSKSRASVFRRPGQRDWRINVGLEVLATVRTNQRRATQFEWLSFAFVSNSELLANFGNFVNRIIKFVKSKCDSTIARVDGLLGEYIDLLDKGRLDNSNLAEKPDRTKTVIGLALNFYRPLASLTWPYVLSTAEYICKQLARTLDMIPDSWTTATIKSGHKISRAAYLFSRVEDKKVGEWKRKFGGSAETRANEEAIKKEKKQEDK